MPKTILPFLSNFFELSMLLVYSFDVNIFYSILLFPGKKQKEIDERVDIVDERVDIVEKGVENLKTDQLLTKKTIGRTYH